MEPFSLTLIAGAIVVILGAIAGSSISDAAAREAKLRNRTNIAGNTIGALIVGVLLLFIGYYFFPHK